MSIIVKSETNLTMRSARSVHVLSGKFLGKIVSVIQSEIGNLNRKLSNPCFVKMCFFFLFFLFFSVRKTEISTKTEIEVKTLILIINEG
jgi:hypothetical protein